MSPSQFEREVLRDRLGVNDPIRFRQLTAFLSNRATNVSSSPSRTERFAEREGAGADASVAGQRGGAGDDRRDVRASSFTAEDVIAFLRAKLEQGVPAWKRMRILHGLMAYRRFIEQRSDEDLVPLRSKMEEIIHVERSRHEGYDTIEESVGLINPREPDVIQAFRRGIRKAGLKLRTERSYPGLFITRRVSLEVALIAARACSCLKHTVEYEYEHRRGLSTSTRADFNASWRALGLQCATSKRVSEE